MMDRRVGYTALPIYGESPYSGLRAALYASSAGTTITASYNVSSLTHNGTGDTTVTFATPCLSISPILNAGLIFGTAQDGSYFSVGTIGASTQAQVITQTDAGTNTDQFFYMAVFRGVYSSS